MFTADFHYDLPPQLIAQVPADKRDASRLLILDRNAKAATHAVFPEILRFLKNGDVLVVNDSKVIPARLRAVKPNTGGAIEVLLVEEIATNDWWAMLRPGKRVRVGTSLNLRDLHGQMTGIECEVLEKSLEGHYRLRFRSVGDIQEHLFRLGEIPLPPYIDRPEGPKATDAARYQTVYANPPGSVAAPTAGLHFTPELLDTIRAKGVKIVSVTLHVGLGTFAPVKAEKLEHHQMHEERYSVCETTAKTIHRTKESGGRVFCVGTTSMRVLESVAATHGRIIACQGKTRIFIYPPFHFRVADALLTNFHLPESTLLMLVSAFAAPDLTDGRDLILNVYREAVRERYRFFSFGDAMLIL